MPDISDLPNEVLGLILHLAVAPTGYRWYLNSHQQRLAVPIGRLRLVCRRWSHCLTEQHFNRELYIRSGTSAMRSSSTKFLGRVWRSLICIKNLRILRLGFGSQRESGESPDHNKDIIYHHRLDCFCSLLEAAPGLECLNIVGIESSNLPEISKSNLDHIQLENISHLAIRSTYPFDQIINVAIRLKSSLEMLSISSSSWDDCHQLLPILETLQDKLGGLSIAHSEVWNPVAHLKFSALRLLKITHWDDCLPDFWQLDMFSYTPIEVLVLSGDHIVKQKADDPASLVDPFAKLFTLRRLVFIGVDLRFSVPESYLRACQEHQVECSYRATSSFTGLNAAVNAHLFLFGQRHKTLKFSSW
ncbi:hypothetical protein PSTG_10842 [Puccinia striiformis f. sp. tritici PST-78]|uniref:F-box domain-containing protein n=1 Tax=Puccinia striiformis f. sp. tritici PST-78 TaxID=1165861 RepID=A0A0L0V9A6_9BASI|nr:hypothetical protein PSTG_10842 [Puccinia striiformis f. sp. tritici PST-78]